MASSGLGFGHDLIDRGIIGKGAFGYVHLVEKQKEQFAVKVMDFSRMSVDREVAENELQVLKKLSHDHVLVYVDAFEKNGQLYILTEFCSGGDLSAFLDASGKPVPEDLLLVWLYQMACGLEYMHTEDPPVLHRDMKPSNIYLTENGDIRLGDLGIARVLDAPGAMATTFCGTPPYMSPEALNEQPYNAKTDVWSLGCCVVEMATLRRAYDGASIYILRDAVLNKREPLPRSFSRDLDRLVAGMLLPNFQDRMSATEILDSPLLEECDSRGEFPIDVLKRHDLLKFLAVGKTPLPSDDDDMTSHLVADSFRDGGETMHTFRVKRDNRMHGRRRDQTVAGSGYETLKTVLHREQKTKTKTTKVKPRVPTQKKTPSGDAMARQVLSSFTSSVASMGQERDSTGQGQGADGSSDSTSSTLVTQLRRTLKQLVGPDAIERADAIVREAAGRAELESGLESVLQASGASDVTLLSQICLFLVLKDSVGPAGVRPS